VLFRSTKTIPIDISCKKIQFSVLDGDN